MNKYKASVDKVSISAKKLAIMAVDEFPPGKVSIPFFRTVTD